jgi:hypothetical protein
MANPGPKIRRFNPVETGIDLFINLLESMSDDMEQKAGWDVSGISLLGPNLESKVKAFIATNKSLLPILETGMKAAIFAALPHLSHESRLAITSLVDLYTDNLRKAMNEHDDGKSEALVAQASANFKSGMTKILDEIAKARKSKLPFIDLLPKLDQSERDEILAWIEWMGTHDPSSHKKWIEYRDRLGSLEIVRQMLRRRELGEFSETTKKRMAFLVGTIGKNPTIVDDLNAFKDTVIGILREGGSTEARIAAFTARANAFAAEQEQTSALIREWNAPRELLRGYPKLRLLLACVFCVLLPIVAIIYIWSQSAPKPEKLKSFHAGASTDGKK